MSILHPTKIKIIAKEIASGNTCYIHRFTSKITIIDLSLEDETLIAAQDLTQAELDRKIDDYVKLEKLSIEDQLVIMKDFLEELSDKSVRKQLANALNRNNPVRNFTQTVESDMALHQHWMSFYAEEYKRWVSNYIIDAYNY